MQTASEAPRGPSLPVKYVVLVALFFLVSYVLRFVLIMIAAQSLHGSGLTVEEATQRAIALYLEDPKTVTTVAAWQGIAWLPIVWLIVVLLERRAFRWADLGLDWRKDTPRALLLGALLAVVACLGYLLVGAAIHGRVPLDANALSTVSLGSAALTLLMFVASGLGEEVAFRGWLQARLLDRQSPIVAIALGSLLFVPLHFLSQPIEPVWLASGLLLWLAIGALYYLTKSLYLVVALHALLNALPAILQVDVAPAATLVVHFAAAALAVWALSRQPQATPRPARSRAAR